MIAAALRNEIEQCFVAASARAQLRRCAAAVQRLTQARRGGTMDGESPALLAMSALVEQAASKPATTLMYQAFCEYVASRLGLEGASLEHVEVTLDAIDDLARDPSELPVLRDHLRRFASQLDQMCQEGLRARIEPELHVSAA